MTIYYRGTAGNNRLQAESLFPFDETIRMDGYAGNDELVGAFLNPNQILGGAGSDTLRGGASSNLLDGGDGNDILNAWQGDYSILRGGNGNDHLTGGGSGNLLDGGAGNDTMIGGDGSDTYVVNSLRDVVQETYAPYYDNDPNPADLVLSSVSWTLGGNLENLTLTGTAAINGTGNTLRNVITGNSGNNTLSGGTGADTLEGGLGNDIFDGGAGIDTLLFSGSTPVRVNLGSIGAQATGLGTDTVRNIENVLSGTGNDTLLGNAGVNTITAGGGNDALNGGAGNDRLIGQIGNDRLRGGAGNDALSGGAGNDSFVFAQGDGSDRISDFADLHDRIVIETGAERFADLRITDLGSDTRITFGNVVLTLANFDHTRLSADDFQFV